MKEKLKILLVEDNMDHAMITKFSLKNIDYVASVAHVETGEDALKYLQIRKITDSYNNEINPELPNLILLDLRLPKLDGLDVLRLIRESELAKDVPVIVLTTSVYQEDIDVTSKLGVSAYMVKPMNILKFKSIADSIMNGA
ncbi:MAG: response regulator [Candidatus Delongbacteria bacterium]|jgi:two-component system response regulator|nr:response regulator [Candidatus Delongbacteria bacterium]